MKPIMLTLKNKNKKALTFLVASILFFSCGRIAQESLYSVPQSLWPESYGNHRAVLKISKAAEVVSLELLWRRHDRNPQDKQFVARKESH